MANNYCVCCGDEVPEGRQVCSICEVEKLRSGGDLNAASKPGTYTVNDERELIGKLEIGIEFKKCAECEYKLRCDEVIPEGRQISPICEKGVDERPKRNIDRIREMTVEKLAEFLDKITYQCRRQNGCERCPLNMSVDCNKVGIAKWLESEVGEK